VVEGLEFQTFWPAEVRHSIPHPISELTRRHNRRDDLDIAQFSSGFVNKVNNLPAQLKSRNFTDV